ncbi:Carboxylesterase type B [Macrophomina phaseolina MS6]|uniref:Carboxylic ester hydrolase n=1 Tax=Macrophomina phaseolina (strain MS6) TaxID=1126212 RepID=K2RGA3_MACPH|nr:Carboxylesterase type B [Macrophomina phaseolina MS6]
MKRLFSSTPLTSHSVPGPLRYEGGLHYSGSWLGQRGIRSPLRPNHQHQVRPGPGNRRIRYRAEQQLVQLERHHCLEGYPFCRRHFRQQSMAATTKARRLEHYPPGECFRRSGGSAAQSLFDGGGMAAQGIVFVNYNRRDGAMGWLAHPQLNAEMAKEVGYNVSGNWGMLDEFAALKWVHDNIDAFGGDPNQITVAGQSAGSAATYHMLNSPLTKGLIKGAIIESGIRYPRDPLASSLAENYQNMSTALAAGVSMLDSLNVTTIDETRQIPLDTILNTGSSSWSATLDYYAMPDTYWNTMLNGPANDVPVITGNTKDESGAALPINITVAEYVANLQEQYASRPAWPKTRTIATPRSCPVGSSRTAGTTVPPLAPSIRTSDPFPRKGKEKSINRNTICSYYWDHAPPGQDQGAYHESEICYALNNLYGTDYPWKEEDFVIARKMNGYWANFVKTHNPNEGGSYADGELVQWNPNDPQKNITMHLGDGWGDYLIAAAAKVELISEFFSTQHAY